MAFFDKISKLTSEQRKKFNTVGDSVGLDAFLSEVGLELTSEEKDEVVKFVASGKQPLTDEELEKVAAGIFYKPEDFKKERQM